MKNIPFYIILIGIFLLLQPYVIGQVENNCVGTDKDISTDPANPVNEEVDPANPNGAGLNTFDWLAEKYDINSAYIASPQIFSPFYQNDNSIVAEFFINKDMKPEDGWELLKYQMGKTETGTNAVPPAGFVYLVLYNKYRGTLRVLVAGDRPTPFNGAQISIELFGEGNTPYLPSILSHKSELKAVDIFIEDDRDAVAVSEYKNGLANWFYADFNTAYDPCVCLYKSRIEIHVTLIQKSSLTLSGEIQGEISSIDNKLDMGDPTENGWSFTPKDLATVAKKATKSYSTINKFVSQQEKALKIEGKTNAELKEAELLKKSELNAFQGLLKKHDFLQKGLSYVPYAAAALDVVSFFVGGGTQSEGPQEVKLTPMSINANVKLSGDLIAPYDFQDIIFGTPGSKDVEIGESSRYPYYNEPLGVFNLLETPEVYQGNYIIPGNLIVAIFRLNKESLKYTINPSAGFKEDPEIFACLEYKDNFEWSPQNNVSIHATAGLDVDEHVMKTRILPIDHLDQITMEISNYTNSTPGTVFLKVFANFERLDADDNTQNVLWVGSFPVTINQLASPGDPLLYNPQQSYDFIQNDLQLGAPVTTDLYAWEKITIGPGTVFQNGSNPIVIMAPTIEVQSGVYIPQNVQLIAQSPILNLGPAQSSKATVSEIADFCNSGAYKSPNRGARSEEQAEIQLIHQIQLNCYPNPFDDMINIDFTLPWEDIVSISLQNQMGQEIAKIATQESYYAGKHHINWNTSDLATGIYYLVLRTNSSVKTTKLVRE